MTTTDDQRARALEDFNLWDLGAFNDLEEETKEVIRAALKSQQGEVDVEDVLRIVSAQAEDDGLWFMAQTASEAYLQQELRILHSAVEGLASGRLSAPPAVAVIEEAIAAYKDVEYLLDIDCPDGSETESVGWSGDEEMPVTFGNISRFRQAMTALSAASAPKKEGAIDPLAGTPDGLVGLDHTPLNTDK